MAIGLNTFLLSCSDDSITETDGIYTIHATEGDDADPPPPPPGG